MTINRITIKSRNSNVSTGIDKHITVATTIGGVTYAPPDLKAVFATQTSALDAADAMHKTWTDQLQVARAAGAKANKLYLLLRSFLIGQYGDDANAILNDFGMSVPKSKAVKTVQTKADAIAKRQATRVARHTMGKVERKKVTGATVAAAAGASASAAPTAPTAPAAVSTAPPTAAPSPAKPATSTTVS